MAGDDTKYVLKLDFENLPKGVGIQIPGLGEFENGQEYEVTEDEAERYRVHHTRQETIYDETDQSILGSEARLGPTLLQASRNMYGVTVETAGSSDEEDDAGSVSADESDEDTEGGDEE